MGWRLPRKAVRQLPASAQLLLKRGKAAFNQSDWAASVKRLRVREQSFIDDMAARNRLQAGRKRFLVFAFQQMPPWLEVSCGLASALQLRGHEVRGILCDGVVPLCEMNLGGIERPPCDVCSGWVGRHEDAFGFSFGRLSELLTADDRAMADREVRGKSGVDLQDLVFEGIEVGRFARRELQRYRRGFVFDPSADPAFAEWIVSGMLIVRMVERLIDRDKPDAIVVSSGRTMVAACVTAVAKARGVRVTSWDTEPTFSDGLVFSHAEPAVLIPLDDLWTDAAHRPLTGSERDELQQFLARWSRSEVTPHPYNPEPETDPAVIRSSLALRNGARMVVAFGNAAWDMAAVDRDVAFKSMFDWLFALVEWASQHPDVDVVVRAHPSETNVPPDLQSRTPVAEEISRRFRPLPANVKLVEGSSPLDSYTLAEMAGVVMVYSSRIGLEMALRGRRPWLAGETTYRGRGFTRDLSSREEMIAALNAWPDGEQLTQESIHQAERFAYLWFFRYVTRLPLLRPTTQPFALKTFRDLAPGGDQVLDRICECVVTGAPFVDLGRNKTQ